MAFNLASLAEKFNPEGKAGKVLLVLNAAGMLFAAASNTFAAAADKNTSAEDKKFLVPAGIFTGVVNIALYYKMTQKIIDRLKDVANTQVQNLSNEELLQKATQVAKAKINKAEKGIFNTGLFKKSADMVQSMKDTLLTKEGIATPFAIEEFSKKIPEGASVMGAFIGAVIGCSIITPIVRDISAYFVQRKMEKRNPDFKELPHKPYFDPAHIESRRYGNIRRQPLSMKNYMAFTNNKLKV